jgi:hypothetical protein
MSLTKQDLTAIEKLIEASESRMITRIDDLDDVLSLQTEHGLQEVRDQIADVKEVVDRIARVQQAELERDDQQDAAINQIRQKLHAV